MFFDGVTIGHAGDVIADCTFEAALVDEDLDVVRQDGWFGAVGIEQVRNDALGFDLHPHHAIMAVQFLVKEILQLAVAALHLFAVADHILFQLLKIQRGFCLAFLQALIGGIRSYL